MGVDGQAGSAFTALLSDLVRLLVLVLGTYGAAFVRSHYAASQIQRAEGIGRTAVWAVEQLAASAGWDSKAKYGRALGFARRLAARTGLRLTDEQWQAILEAAVASLRAVGAELPTAPPGGPPAPPASPRPPRTGAGAPTRPVRAAAGGG